MSRRLPLTKAIVRSPAGAVAFAAFLLATVLASCSNSSSSGGPTPATCDGVCSREPLCGAETSPCVSDCQSFQTACTAAGHEADFQTFLNCETTATFTCDGNVPQTADCKPQFMNVVNACLGGADAGGPPEAGNADAPKDATEAGEVATDGGDLACGSTTTLMDCIVCCSANHQAGVEFFNNAINNCVCVNPGPCKTQCASEACMNQQPASGDACDMCVNQNASPGQPCYAPVQQACQGNADCKAFFDCLMVANCAAKQ